MKYTFTPKNHLDAFSFFMQVPSYGLWSVVYKKDLVFKNEEISYVEINTEENVSYRMFYKTKYFHGHVDIREKFNRADFVDVNVKPVQKKWSDIFSEAMQDSLNLTFYRHSPVLWVMASTILVTFLFWFFSVPFNLLNPEIVGNSFCDLDCVNTLWKKIMNVYMSLAVSVAGLAVVAYLNFFKSKKYTEAKFIRSMQTSSFIVLIFLSFRLTADIKKVSTPRFMTENQIVFKPHYFKSTNERAIASQKGFK